MLNRLPKPTQLPPLQWMLDDIGNPTAQALARALGVTRRTVERWRKAGHAPRAAMLAIYWLTRWGMDAVHCEAHNAAQLHAGMSDCLKREGERLKAEIETLNAKLARLGRIADFGSANDPASGVELPAKLPELVSALDVKTARATGQTHAINRRGNWRGNPATTRVPAWLHK